MPQTPVSFGMTELSVPCLFILAVIFGSSRGNFPILSRDPDLSGKPQTKKTVGHGDRFLKTTIAEKYGIGMN